MKFNNKLNTRLKKIEGQVRGIQKMIEVDTYCIDVITQTSAVRSALKSLEDVMLEEHLQSCVINQVKNGKEDKAVSEILKVYKLKR
jgi:DNA-binding FrmR family transcriptional regulator